MNRALAYAVMLHLMLLALLIPWRAALHHQIVVPEVKVIPAYLVEQVPQVMLPDKRRVTAMPIQESAEQYSETQPAHQTVVQAQHKMASRHVAEIAPEELKALLKEMTKQIQRHLIYPEVARINGWHGKVLVQFQLLGSGDIREVKTFESSGYMALDNAAIKAVRALQKIDLGSVRFQHPIMLRLPVIFTGFSR